MQVTFYINYRTRYGQQIAIVSSQGEQDQQNPFILTHSENGNWSGTITVNPKDDVVLNYNYVCLQNYEIVDEEWGERQLDLRKEKNERVHVSDIWRTKTADENALDCSAFQEVIFKQTKKIKPPKAKKSTAKVVFNLNCPQVESGLQIAVLGNVAALGNWDYSEPFLLGNASPTLWSGEVNLDTQNIVEYKYGLYDPQQKKVLSLETGENRSLIPSEKETLVLNDEYFRHVKGLWKGTGIAMPVFSLRTQGGLGVGEFRDIKTLVDWAKQVDFKMVQILPVNDTSATHTWVDSYPYAAISVFALHPLYLNINEIKGFEKVINQKEFEAEKTRLNELAEVDYEAVMSLKLKWAKQLFEADKVTFLKDKKVQAFISENEHWLKPYAAFCYLRDKNGTVDFTKWKSYNTFSAAGLKRLTNSKAKHFDEIAFHYFLQYYLSKQLKEASDYARKQGIVLKGDIPIGIYRYSVDAWVKPQLYNMNGQAGAPPDPFSDSGQNWGFPTYNWEEMEKDGYQWWKNRFQQLSHYFDAFRIDHILGFFRIWQIPLSQVEGMLGFFNPAIPIHRNEFTERGIHFDEIRFCQPYIREHLLTQLFGKDAQFVKLTFLDNIAYEQYQFKAGYNTQRKIEAWLKDKVAWKHLKEGLFQLIANVLFLSVPESNGQHFHPRIDFLKISSFKELDGHLQHKLEALYNDYFYHRQEDFWKEQAMTKLPAMKAATNMLICGEDLGMVPASVPGVMKELGILSLEIQRMSKIPTTEFLQERDIPYLSVASPSTHDMSPIRLWWEEMKWEQKQRFFNQELGFDGKAPYFCESWLAERMIQQHLDWPSMWIVFPMQDLLAIDVELRRENPIEERINVPANPKHYWRYRLHFDLERLVETQQFNERVKGMVKKSGR